MPQTAIANESAAAPAPLLTHPRPPGISPAPPSPWPEETALGQSAARWSLARRICFRFLVIYVLLYFLPMPLREIIGAVNIVGGEAVLPVTSKAFEYVGYYDTGWEKVVIPVGKTLFNIDIKIVPTGSGDTSAAYVQVLCIFVIATLGALIWSGLDRRRLAYPRLHEWLRVYVRYVLAFTMLGYGMAKVIQTQFPPPGPERLMQTFGSASPMGLLWTFMGASTAYTFFAGFMECVGGLLLIPRRTVTLGAIVVTGTMLNVVVLNFCYDVPVKQYSMHLTLFALWLMLPDLPALMAVLLRTKPVPPAPVQPLFRRAWLRYPALIFALALVGIDVYGGLTGNYERWKQMSNPASGTALAGLYEVESFTRTGADGVVKDDPKTRWRRFIVNNRSVAGIQQADDHMPRFRFTDDAANKTISMANPNDPSKGISLKYDTPEPGILILEGQLFGDTISVRLRKSTNPEFFLTTRGFNWVQEFPLNR